MNSVLIAPILGGIDWHILFQRIANGQATFWRALSATVYLSVSAEVLGIILGIITVAIARSPVKPLRFLAWLYRLVIRGTPPIVQIFFIYYGANLLLGFNLFPTLLKLGIVSVPGAVIAGIAALGINEGAYMSEIIRGGLDSVDPGQLEAALAVGLTRRQAMRRIIAPQAARVIIPTIGNQYNYMIKATSLLSFIGVYELFEDAEVGYSATFRPVEYFLGVAFWYLVLTTVWSLIQAQIERKLGASERATDRETRSWWRQLADVLGREEVVRL
jgi:polar amino acid transport system permease protein